MFPLTYTTSIYWTSSTFLIAFGLFFTSGDLYSFGEDKVTQSTSERKLKEGKSQAISAAPPAISFMEKQLEFYRQKLSQSSTRVQQFKQENSLISLEDQQRLLLEQRKELDTSLKEILNNISGLDTKLSWLKEQIKHVPKKVPLSSVTDQQAVNDQAQQNLLELQLKEQELLSRYKETSRSVVSVRNEIELVKKYIREQQTTSLEDTITTGKNPVYQEIEMEILRTEGELISERARRTVTRQQLTEIDQELHRLNHLEKDLQELLRQVSADERNYVEYLAMVGTTPPHNYRLQVGDQLDIKFFFNPELNEAVAVRPDGRISLQLVGELMAAGSTVEELKALLKQRYAKELKNPEITVILRSFSANAEANRRPGNSAGYLR